MSPRRGWRQAFGAAALDGRAVLVADGGRGVGAAVCHELAVHGAQIAVLDAASAAAEATSRRIRAIGGEALAVVGDAAREEVARRAVAATREAFGRLDAVVACCRSGPAEPLHELDPESWDRGIQGAVRGVFLIARYALPLMKQRGFGNVVCVCETEAGLGAETASRANLSAILGFCDALRASQARYRIRVSAVLAPAAGPVRWAPPELELACVPDVLEAAAMVREQLAGPREPVPPPRAIATAPRRASP